MLRQAVQRSGEKVFKFGAVLTFVAAGALALLAVMQPAISVAIQQDPKPAQNPASVASEHSPVVASALKNELTLAGLRASVGVDKNQLTECAITAHAHRLKGDARKAYLTACLSE